ncbi:N-acetylmuramic acid 6-phosphate etherase [Sphingomonas adhaesiva]|uniref:N-acetylmuramic acid 6-phosphate etherase n=1 Tax=Sphingomonas adhaesiva TaxID=28212 RepID=UPI002FF9FF0F
MSTETNDPRFAHIDQWPLADAVQAMWEGQLAAVAAVQSQVPAIAAAAEAAATRLGRGGRLAYAGAGTSGRIAVQDGVELYPTFNWPQERLVFLMAGGLSALTEAAEGAEDDGDAAYRAVAEAGLGAADVLVAVAASGRTPFTRAAVTAARAAGALTIALANNAGAPLLADAEHALPVDTGTELIAGSTRMKAGTAQKAVLNMLSTAIMLRRGLVHDGLMVNMRVSNDKLRARAQRMVAEIAGVEADAAATALAAGGEEIRNGVLIALGAAPGEAAALVARHDTLRQAMAAYGQGIRDA